MSYASDITLEDTPFTIGLSDLSMSISQAITSVRKRCSAAKEPIPRKLVGANFGGDPVGSNDKFWDVHANGEVVGRITRCCYSPRLEHNIALVNVPTDVAEPGTKVQLDIRGTLVDAEIVALPWFESHKKIPEGI